MKRLPNVGDKVSFPTGKGILVLPPDVNGVVIVEDERGEYKRVAASACEPLDSVRKPTRDDPWTPGPWAMSEPRRHTNWLEISITDGYSTIAELRGATNAMCDHLAGACHVMGNANLIEASPVLYEALENLVGYAELCSPHPSEAVDDAHAALAEARGESGGEE